MSGKKRMMGGADRRKFRALLLKLRERLTKSVNHIASDTLSKTQREASGELSGYTFHMADMASDNYEREFSLELASGERETLMEIDDALRRLKDKAYGACLECGKPISKKRLTAVPFAKFCLKCKEDMEDRA